MKDDGLIGASRPGVGSSAAGSAITPEQIYSTLLGSMSVASSTETLLRNIEGLLRVAADSARQQERQVHLERGESIDAFIRSRILFIPSLEHLRSSAGRTIVLM